MSEFRWKSEVFDMGVSKKHHKDAFAAVVMPNGQRIIGITISMPGPIPLKDFVGWPFSDIATLDWFALRGVWSR